MSRDYRLFLDDIIAAITKIRELAANWRALIETRLSDVDIKTIQRRLYQ